jgi:NAD dependent epimerase/dehydratase family enzyme
MSKNKIFGPVNLATPNPVTNSSFMLVMRRFFAPLGIGLPSPIWAVRFGTFFMRTAPDLVLKSRKLVSKVLLDFGYNFKHANIKSAIKQLY